jgi:4-amino-4-deoxy-L-arabinose transferase-like glycosyltransferase
MAERVEREHAGVIPVPGAHRRMGLLIGLVAGLAVVLTLGDPGLTVDEPLDVRPGRTYVATLRRQGWRFFDPGVVEAVFRDNAEHPPLGRWLLGAASTLAEPFEVLLRGSDPTGLYVLSGRLAPALAFAVLVGAITAEAARRWNRAAGIAAGWALLVMPRVFAHAHLAALDTFLSLFWTLGLLAGARALDRQHSSWHVVGAGAAWSLALLTKIHAWLLLPILTGWAIAKLPWRRAVTAIMIWTMTGVGLFLLGWPGLWYGTWSRWRAYWGTSLQRVPIMVEYFGQVVPDRDVPWHYPWFYFIVTVPVGLQMMGLYGLSEGWRVRRLDVFPGLLAASIGVFLVLFSTRIPVYDGERLFLHVFPAWAMLIGLGFGRLWERWGRDWVCRSLLALFLLAQGYGVLALHPFGLSYYNLLTGGLPGAERLGLELTYWSDAVDRVLLEKLAREARSGATAALAPTLYREQGKATTTSCLLRRDIVLQDEESAAEAEWLVLSRREAYWRPELKARLKGGEGTRVATRSRQGVWLSALWHFPPDRSGRDSTTIKPDHHQLAARAPRSGAPAFLPPNALSAPKPQQSPSLGLNSSYNTFRMN